MIFYKAFMVSGGIEKHQPFNVEHYMHISVSEGYCPHQNRRVTIGNNYVAVVNFHANTFVMVWNMNHYKAFMISGGIEKYQPYNVEH